MEVSLHRGGLGGGGNVRTQEILKMEATYNLPNIVDRELGIRVSLCFHLRYSNINIYGYNEHI